MSDLLRVTGMYSGMDTETIVSQLVSARSMKVTNLKNEQKKLEWKQTAWQDLNSKLYSLYSKTLSKLRLTGAYNKKTTTSSDSTKATVVASSSAVNGSQTLQVNKLAKAGYLTGAKLSPKTDSDGEETAWTTSDTLGDINRNLDGKLITVTTGTGADKKETDITLSSSMTINDFVTKLNEAGVNASFDQTNQRFFISSTGTGADNEFSLWGANVGTEEGTLGMLGLDATATYSNGSESTKVEAQDAEIVLNGATFTSSSNSFSVNGLTINTLGVTDGEISITTSTDQDGIYNTIKDFLTEYNDLIVEMDKLYNADSARKYDMLTDEEKETMTDEQVETWENTIKASLLRKDNNLNSVMSSFITTMQSGFYTKNLTEEQKKNMTEGQIAKWYEENGNKKYLSDFGIKTKNYFECEDNEHYAFHIDGDEDDEYSAEKDDKLRTAIAADPEGIAEFFAGLCKGLYDELNKTMGTSTEYSSIYKTYNDKQLKSQYEDYTTKIKEAEKELNDYEDSWYKKFSAMEVALSKLQSNSSAVTSMLGN